MVMVPPPTASIADRLLAVRHRIARAARAAGRDPSGITLVAVAKTYPAEDVEAALATGQLEFGENRVQESAGKYPALRTAHPALRLHLIGQLQTNKALDAVRLCDVIESVDRTRLADALEGAAAKAGRLPALLAQVNIGDEPQKAGIGWNEADGFVRSLIDRFGAAMAGVMGIAPAGVDPRPYFERLAGLRARHGLPVLSMGMSGDFEVAIACGATHVRVGSAIFGDRAP